MVGQDAKGGERHRDAFEVRLVELGGGPSSYGAWQLLGWLYHCVDGSTEEGLVGEGRRRSMWSVLSLEASRTSREMGGRQLDEGTSSSRESLDTDSGGGRRERRDAGTHPFGV